MVVLAFKLLTLNGNFILTNTEEIFPRPFLYPHPTQNLKAKELKDKRVFDQKRRLSHSLPIRTSTIPVNPEWNFPQIPQKQRIQESAQKSGVFLLDHFQGQDNSHLSENRSLNCKEPRTNLTQNKVKKILTRMVLLSTTKSKIHCFSFKNLEIWD